MIDEWKELLKKRYKETDDQYIHRIHSYADEFDMNPRNYKKLPMYELVSILSYKNNVNNNDLQKSHKSNKLNKSHNLNDLKKSHNLNDLQKSHNLNKSNKLTSSNVDILVNINHLTIESPIYRYESRIHFLIQASFDIDNNLEQKKKIYNDFNNQKLFDCDDIIIFMNEFTFYESLLHHINNELFEIHSILSDLLHEQHELRARLSELIESREITVHFDKKIRKINELLEKIKSY